jgi:hypothetical protein
MIKDVLKYLEPNAAIPIDMETTIMLVNALKEALAQEKALQALHDENERLGLYRDAYAQQEQEPVAWVCYGSSDSKMHDIDFEQIDVDALPVGTMLYTNPPQRTEPLIGCVNHDCDKCMEQQVERNFCPRCGKRTKDLTHIHTCTPPPREGT